MKNIFRTSVFLRLSLVFLLALLVVTSLTFLSPKKAHASVACPGITAFRDPPGSYYGTIYVDGSCFRNASYGMLVTLYDYVDGDYLHPIKWTTVIDDYWGDFDTSVPPHCSYSQDQVSAVVNGILYSAAPVYSLC